MPKPANYVEFLRQRFLGKDEPEEDTEVEDIKPKQKENEDESN